MKIGFDAKRLFNNFTGLGNHSRTTIDILTAEFPEHEYYLYTLANGTQLGVAIESGKWNDTTPYMSQLVSEGDENFRFGQMYEATASNVHPFLYYALVHFVSSIFTGIFSKWIGLSINILLLIPILIVVKKLAWKLSGENEIITLITMLLCGLSPATMSMTMLIRMYLLLSLWTLWYAYLHVMDLEREKLSVTKFLLPVFICGFCGFLTQYFFVVIMFFITFVYAFYLLVFCRRVKDAVIYGFTALFSLICTYFVWPVSYFHIFKGYRGKGAVSQLKDVAHLGKRLFSHLDYLNTMVFAGTLPVFAILLIAGTVLLLRRVRQLRKQSQKNILRSFSVSTRGIILLSIAAVLNFLILTQLGLLDGITCCRHTYTSYALFLVLLPSCTYKLLTSLMPARRQIASACTIAAFLAVLLLGYVEKNVLFLYEGEKVATTYAKEHPDAKVVMFQADNGMYDSRIQELIMYPQVYYISVNDLSTAEDETIANADELLVYMTTQTDDQEACFESIYRQNPKLTQADHLWDSNYFFSVYLMH